MADSAVQFEHCVNQPDLIERPLDDADPFTALRFHFGMLLGVADFDAGQAYHRGKMRLHNAWLHGAGVVWGLDVRADAASGEIRVEPGLALDAAGHELHLDASACVHVGSWYGKREKDPEVTAAITPVAGGVTFDAYVVARFRACLTREVPALAEPCGGSNTDTAFSRVSETIELELHAGRPALPTAVPFERLRVLFGLQAPRVDAAGAVVPEHQEVLDARRGLDALPLDRRGPAREAMLRHFAALDTITLRPYAEPASYASRFPADDRAPLLLATIEGIQLKAVDESWALAKTPTVHTTVRPSLLPTLAIQQQLAAWPEPGIDAGGPRFKMDAPTAASITLTADKPLADATVADDAFTVTSRADAAAKWTPRPVTAALAPDKKTVTLTLVGPAFGATDLVRVIARGTGPTPILGEDDVPLAGAVGDPSSGQEGRDFVAMQTRS